jgi:REP element-mobilizing transposase RayT
MPSTHTSLHLHIVFSTRNREPWFEKHFRPELHAYMAGVVKGLQAHPRQIGGVADHVHLLVDLKSTHQLSGFVQELKKSSTQWVRETLHRSAFQWQEGYGAFTVGSSELDRLISYIRNQEEHHRHQPFHEEYKALLNASGISYDPAYLW